jgi:hypothetical protein
MGLSGVVMAVYDSCVIPSFYRWLKVKWCPRTASPEHPDYPDLPLTPDLHLRGIYYEDLRHHVFTTLHYS